MPEHEAPHHAPQPEKWRYLVLDLWMATGRESGLFEAFCDEHGAALTWSLLLAEVRSGGRCWEPLVGDDWCVLTEGHVGPHYGAQDVGAPVDLPQPTNERRRLGA